MEKSLCYSRIGLSIDFHAARCIWTENSGMIWTLFRKQLDTWGGFGQRPYPPQITCLNPLQGIKSINTITKVIKWLRLYDS